MKKEIIVRKNGTYLRVPVESMYIDDGELDAKVSMKYPIKNIEKLDRGFKIQYMIRNFEHYIQINRYQMKDKLMRNNLTDTEVDKIMEYEREKGLRIKTKKGFIWEIEANKVGNKDLYKFYLNTSKVLSNFKNREVYFPNIYNGGAVCWGNVSRMEPEMPLEDGGNTFITFIESIFNTELESTYRGMGLYNYLLNKRIKRDEVDDLTWDTYHILRSKLEDRTLSFDGDLILMIISTVWDIDNIDLDNQI